MISGYFQIGFLSDDYVNIYSANVSSLLEKFTSNVVFHNHLLLRPLWFLSLTLDIFIKKSLSLSADNFIVFRIHNLILYLVFAFLVSYIYYFKSKNYSLSIFIYTIVLIFPNNIHSLIWVVCRHDTQFGIFGLLSLFMILLYAEKNKLILLLLSLVFLATALLYKETAIIFPFVILFALYYFNVGNNKVKIKNYVFHFLILLVYIVYKLFFLNSSTGNIINNYSVNLTDRLSVLPKALFSLYSSTDYLSLNYYFRQENMVYLLLILIPFVLISITSFISYKEKPKKVILLIFLFVILIMPNIIAGYFRPQLIIVPFSILLFFSMSDVSLLNDKSRLLIKYILVVLVLIFAISSYSVIRDYEYSYSKIKNDIKLISDNLHAYKEKPVILFLPSRLKQTYILDNVQAAYNYFKYNDFVIKDTVQGFVNYAALDAESLNSEITIQRLNDFTIVATCTGETQFFYNISNNSITDYENEYIKCEFQKEYMFLNKCKKVKLILKDLSKYNYTALTNNKLINLNPR
jgi:hypothetical protein